jgi:hypothetical protein
LGDFRDFPRDLEVERVGERDDDERAGRADGQHFVFTAEIAVEFLERQLVQLKIADGKRAEAEGAAACREQREVGDFVFSLKQFAEALAGHVVVGIEQGGGLDLG